MTDRASQTANPMTQTRVPFGVVLWFVVLVYMATAAISWVALLVLSRSFSAGILVFGLVLAGFVATVPALVWGLGLNWRSDVGKTLGTRGHLGFALLSALAGIPGLMAVYFLLVPVIRFSLDPTFDQMGFFFVYAIVAAVALLVVFPALALVFKWRASQLGISRLFPEGNDAA